METWQLIALFLSILGAVVTAFYLGYSVRPERTITIEGDIDNEHKEWEFRRRRLN